MRRAALCTLAGVASGTISYRALGGDFYLCLACRAVLYEPWFTLFVAAIYLAGFGLGWLARSWWRR